MKKSEMYKELLDKVCEVCEVDPITIITGRKMQSVVDARLIHVQYLRRIGLSSDDIALCALRELNNDPTYCPPQDVLTAKAKAVDKIFNSYSARCLESYAFGLMSIEVKEYCHQRYSTLLQNGMKQLPTKI